MTSFSNAPSTTSFLFTAIVTIEPHGTGTKYTATAIHADEASATTHKEMGFHDGWGAAFDQLVAWAQDQPSRT